MKYRIVPNAFGGRVSYRIQERGILGAWSYISSSYGDFRTREEAESFLNELFAGMSQIYPKGATHSSFSVYAFVVAWSAFIFVAARAASKCMGG